jgi:muramidase (phage lysozyme)
MDRTVPAGAAYLLTFISDTETGNSAPQCYEVIFGHNERKLKKPLTSMTLDEVEADGPRRTRVYGSSAAGAYQFMRDTLDKPGTLLDIEGEMGLSGKELFSPDLQDRMGYHLLKRRGYQSYIAGKIDITEFGKRLAQEWASFPVLADCQGAHRKLKRGQSYYAGDGLNKALVKPEKVETILKRVKELAKITIVDTGSNTPAPKPAPPVGTPEPGFWAAFLAIIKAFIRGGK